MCITSKYSRGINIAIQAFRMVKGEEGFVCHISGFRSYAIFSVKIPSSTEGPRDFFAIRPPSLYAIFWRHSFCEYGGWGLSKLFWQFAILEGLLGVLAIATLKPCLCFFVVIKTRRRNIPFTPPPFLTGPRCWKWPSLDQKKYVTVSRLKRQLAKLGIEKYLPPPPREQEKRIFRGRLWLHPPLR